jgi:hypothetical protein
MRAALSRGLAACSIVFLAACAGLVPESSTPVAEPSSALRDVALANPGFEDAWIRPDCPPHWGCLVHSDPAAFRFFSDEAAPASGKASLCVEPKGHEPWGLASNVLLDHGLGGHRLRFTLRVRVANVTGGGGGVFATVHDGFGHAVAHEQRLVTGTSSWQALSVEFEVPKDMHDVDVGALLEGRGRVCADDAKLEVLR